MSYVDGFVIPILKKNIPAYIKMAKVGGKIWKKHGALDYKECIGDDLKKTKWSLSFTAMAKAKPNETVVFSYILFKSKAHRNQVNAKVMKDPAMDPDKYKDVEMPFDMKRMGYGGFKVIVDAK